MFITTYLTWSAIVFVIKCLAYPSLYSSPVILHKLSLHLSTDISRTLLLYLSQNVPHKLTSHLSPDIPQKIDSQLSPDCSHVLTLSLSPDVSHEKCLRLHHSIYITRSSTHHQHISRNFHSWRNPQNITVCRMEMIEHSCFHYCITWFDWRSFHE